jgi:hypothetical protein
MPFFLCNNNLISKSDIRLNIVNFLIFVFTAFSKNLVRVYIGALLGDRDRDISCV